eukprot:745814-Hanusia_phi.AAC.5
MDASAPAQLDAYEAREAGEKRGTPYGPDLVRRLGARGNKILERRRSGITVREWDGGRARRSGRGRDQAGQHGGGRSVVSINGRLVGGARG